MAAVAPLGDAAGEALVDVGVDLAVQGIGRVVVAPVLPVFRMTLRKTRPMSPRRLLGHQCPL